MQGFLYQFAACPVFLRSRTASHQTSIPPCSFSGFLIPGAAFCPQLSASPLAWLDCGRFSNTCWLCLLPWEEHHLCASVSSYIVECIALPEPRLLLNCSAFVSLSPKLPFKYPAHFSRLYPNSIFGASLRLPSARWKPASPRPRLLSS
ncbi:uncharacterized protein CC84DRAFT_276169 [Paraphaeosphaeria sporulosa]|uniref:Uncharacterized protein n=1 Tax=Paraphaeosphaeria sporulosa TaxID=1460663 RepID=A0A177C318_9PLEO|nr:uncharacterized protein CC84DRAFT_276169 [Paraphaeosphaeria sporulosa]OAG01060.1 hypothetical protein CC84DRAFT_276169 [Paraphaeosphaeria sporulosa]